jgi:hypothetical protein
VSKDREDEARKLFLPMKNNIGPDGMGLAFHIEQATIPSAGGPLATSHVAWESEAVSITADEAMQAERPESGSPAMDDATKFLHQTLVNGPVPAKQVLELAMADAISEKTLRRAARALNVQKTKGGMAAGWMWSLPAKMAKIPEDAQQKDMATFDGFGHLQDLHLR